MSDFGERVTSGTGLDRDLAVIKRATRLLVDDPHTVREDTSHFGSKFPRSVLIAKTPDFDRVSGMGARVSYRGTIDRATRDAMPDFDGDRPFVTFESGSWCVPIPVVPRKPMATDDEAIAQMPLSHIELAAIVAGDILDGLHIA